MIGATALWLMYAWLACAIVASYLSYRKGYGEKSGLAAGLLLHVIGVIIFLVDPGQGGLEVEDDRPVRAPQGGPTSRRARPPRPTTTARRPAAAPHRPSFVARGAVASRSGVDVGRARRGARPRGGERRAARLVARRRRVGRRRPRRAGAARSRRPACERARAQRPPAPARRRRRWRRGAGAGRAAARARGRCASVARASWSPSVERSGGSGLGHLHPHYGPAARARVEGAYQSVSSTASAERSASSSSRVAVLRSRAASVRSGPRSGPW